jgi:FkbM family methyltransferase
MSGNLKRRLNERLTQVQIALDAPGALKARLAGCYFETYCMVYRLLAIGLKPRVILDIGANRGMFSRCAHYVFPDATIYAFEPLRDCYEKLRNLRSKIKKLECYNVALAGEVGEKVIHRSSYDYSSSLLEMEGLHKEAFPYTAGERLEKVQVNTLDGILHDRFLEKPILMKIDVQGYEKFVLLGAQRTLQQTDYVLCEMSVRPLYQGQALFDEIYRRLASSGFRFSGQIGELRHPKSSEVLQIDGLFIKET